MSNVIVFRRPATPAPDEDLLVDRYRYLVRGIARRLCRANHGLDYSVLEADGLYGLLIAIRRFDPTCGAQFTTYATLKIRGAMIDGLRRDSETSRMRPSAEETAAAIDSANRERSAAEAFGAVPCGLPAPGGRRRRQFVSLDAVPAARLSVAPVGVDPMLFGRVQRLLSTLSDTEQSVIRLLYFDGLGVVAVAEVVGLSPGRVSNIHARVLDKLRRSLLPTDGQFALVA